MPRMHAAHAAPTATGPLFDPWLWAIAFQQSWLATLDPTGNGVAQRRHRLSRLIDTVVRDSPLYARRSHGARRLDDFEPIGKVELMRHFDDWATDRRITRRAVEAFVHDPTQVGTAWLGRYLVWTSSGTTGEPAVFVQDAASLAAYDAIDALRLRSADLLQPVLGLWGLGKRFAYVGALGGHYAGHVNLTRLLHTVPAPYALRVTLLSALEPLAETAQRLLDLQPDVLITYPSCAAALAQGAAGGALHLTEAWLGGEQLTPNQRSVIRDAFGCTVRNGYGASEFYSIAFECPYGHLHLNDDWVILEPVDASGCTVPVGVFGHLTWLTHLANRTQPLIRYQLTDRVRFMRGRCACGNALPMIEVQGRSDDVLDLPGRHGAPVRILPLALETVIEEDAGVTDFQVLRRTDGALELRLRSQGDTADRAFVAWRDAVRPWLERQGADVPRLVQGRDEPLRDAASGKLRRVIDLRSSSTARACGPSAHRRERAQSPQA